LAKAIEEYAMTTGEEIIVQLGHTKYHPKGVKCFKFISPDKLEELIEKADIIITQGGFGSILTCLEKGKKVIAIPRRKDLNECRDDGLGQEEIVRQLEQEGKILALYDTRELSMAIEKARQFNFKVMEKRSRIPELILDFVQKVLGERR
jgi:UDP-N-acetylglucosamine transferase subunit ALG13